MSRQFAAVTVTLESAPARSPVSRCAAHPRMRRA